MKIKLLKFKSVKSTNDVALRLIKRKNLMPTIILTEKQTQGKTGWHKPLTWKSKEQESWLAYIEFKRKFIDV